VNELIANGVEETVALGERWGCSAGRGTVFALDGDLGAGKTQLARGIARGLGYRGRVQSPSFGLVNVYEGGRLTMFHLDLYRLETEDEIRNAGLEEYLDNPDGVTVVEWASRWFAGRTADVVRVLMETTGEDERRILHDHVGD
jgi:tRNA threonylcarbamoyladenosine biosynthesis protein TsaE